MHLQCGIVFKGRRCVSHMFSSILAGTLYNKCFWQAVHFKDISGEIIQIIAGTSLLTERAASVPKASQFHHLTGEICILLLLGHPMLGACEQLSLPLPAFTTYGSTRSSSSP